MKITSIDGLGFGWVNQGDKAAVNVVGLLKGINDESEQSALLDVVPSDVTVAPSMEGVAGRLALSFAFVKWLVTHLGFHKIRMLSYQLYSIL